MQIGDSLEKILILGNIEGKRRRGWQMMGWLNSITESMGMNLSKFQEIVEDKGALCSTVHGSQIVGTWLSNETTNISAMKPSGFKLLFCGEFVLYISDSISFLVIGLSRFSISHSFSHGRVYVSKNSSISSVFSNLLVYNTLQQGFFFITLMWFQL